ncbi:MAG TPA: tetratricopeptide repeat protein [Planctomycetota bacterium]|nr:tetratricopeptide repeat protein [Planctomycetota bacterium]
MQIFLPSPRSTRGRTPLVVTAALVLAIAATLAVLYKPWNPLRYGRAEPPLPSAGELEPPLARRIQERVDRVHASPYDAKAWGQLGETYDVHEQYPQAIFCYERAQKLDPKEARWPYLLGIAQRIGDQKAALACFERAIALAPDMASAHFFAGHGYLQSERYDDAAREFQRADELQPDVPATKIGLGKVALSKNDPQRAIECLTRAEELHPATSEARWLLAAAWRAQGDEAKAATFANAGDPPPKQEVFPDRLRAEQFRAEGVTLHWARERARLALDAAQPEQAVKELQAYLDQVPTSAMALSALGDVYMQVEKPEEAVARYQAALTVDPTRAGTLAALGNALARTGKPEEGLAKIRQALALEPTNVDFKGSLAGLLVGKPDAASRAECLSLIREISQARPEDLISWINLAQAESANGNADAAIAAFQRALALAPEDPSVRHEYGVLCARLGRMAEAAEAFAAVVKAAPSRMEARSNWIRALTELGRDKEAIAAVRGALEIAPKSVQLRAQLAWMLATSTDDAARSGSEALTLAKALVQESAEKNSEMLVIQGAAQAELGDFPSASKSIDDALELLKPKPGEIVSDPMLSNIIDKALACRKAFKESKPYHAAAR